tara:strand:- start:1044 stop:1478 length:435 start_codon:yes stop_codon:yes gene_type:complete
MIYLILGHKKTYKIYNVVQIRFLEVNMAKKGKKTAVRQSQLNTRKRKKSRSLQVVDSRFTESENSVKQIDDNETLSNSTLPQETLKTETRKPIKPAKAPAPAPTSTPAPTALTYPYLNRELLQISLTSLIVVAVLVGLNFTIFN